MAVLMHEACPGSGRRPGWKRVRFTNGTLAADCPECGMARVDEPELVLAAHLRLKPAPQHPRRAS